VSRYSLTDVQITSLKAYNLGFRSRRRMALAATASTPWGGVRIWNVHLDTRINAGERLQQLQPVMEDAACHAGPKLIGGDFNTNDYYWVGNILPVPFSPAQTSTIRKSMLQHGFYTPFASRVTTFPLLGSHLDWIFLSELQAVSSSVEPARFSDHHAVWVGARL
jgi:endonuclease/exonuclease/phosphatase family metal-dependent hydrolase